MKTGEASCARSTAAFCNGWVTYKCNILSPLVRVAPVDKYGFKSQSLQTAKGGAQWPMRFVKLFKLGT
jgi:hypothetical protein